MNIQLTKPNKKLLIILYLTICLGIGLSLGFLKRDQKKISNSAQLANSQDQTQIIQTSVDESAKIIPEAPEDIDQNLSYKPTEVTADSKQIGMLFLGYGGAGHDGGYLSDAIILARLDLTKKKLAFIHIPRDIWVTIQVGDLPMPMKINSAMAMGTKTKNYPTTTVSKDSVLRAATLTKQGVTTITGLPVDFVVGVDFNGFSQAINSLKGIEVQVPTTFNDPWYPKKGYELELCGHSPEAVTAMSATMSGFSLEKQFPCRYEQLHFEAGTVHMDGETALKYGRSRHTSSDYARGRRQITIIQATIDKLFSLKALDSVPSFYSSLTKAVKTDLSLEQTKLIIPILKMIPDLEVVEIGLDTTNVLDTGKAKAGAFILLPKDGEDQWKATHQYISSHI